MPLNRQVATTDLATSHLNKMRERQYRDRERENAQLRKLNDRLLDLVERMFGDLIKARGKA